jgi:hypothetical protein
LSGSVESPPFPWLYPYQEDGPRRLHRIVHRPIVPVALVGSDVTAGQFACVDSGCSHVLAAPWLAVSAGVEPKNSNRVIDLGIGGAVVKTRFVDMRLRLLAPDGSDEHFIEYETEVGFFDSWKPTFTVLLGQVGFLDQFTVTMSQHAMLTAVEPLDVFDDRFGVPLAP